MQCSEALTRELDALFSQNLAKWDRQSMTIAVVQGEEVVYSGGFGLRDVGAQRPATPETIYAIGSASKAFTAAAAGILVDRGLLEWDRPIREYLPWFRLWDKTASDQANTRDLLSHKLGLPRHEMMWYLNRGMTRRQLVEHMADLKPNAPFRQVWQYQNLSYVTIGYLIEALTGQTWEDFVRENFFLPLEMTRTNLTVRDSQKDENFALPYEKREGEVVQIPFYEFEIGGSDETPIAPAGAINSCVLDMAKWLSLNLGGGTCRGKQLLKSETMAEIHTMQQPMRGPLFGVKELLMPGYGFGWMMACYRGRKLLIHAGNIDGFTAVSALMPEENLGIAVMTNITATSLEYAAVLEALDRFLPRDDTPLEDWDTRFRDLLKASVAQVEAVNKPYLEQQIENAPPSRPLADFSGRYSDVGYGALTVGVAGDQLTLEYGVLRGTLRHLYYDTFFLDHLMFKGPITFHTDKLGVLSALTSPMNAEPGAEDIVFLKQKEGK